MYSCQVYTRLICYQYVYYYVQYTSLYFLTLYQHCSIPAAKCENWVLVYNAGSSGQDVGVAKERAESISQASVKDPEVLIQIIKPRYSRDRECIWIQVLNTVDLVDFIFTIFVVVTSLLYQCSI